MSEKNESVLAAVNAQYEKSQSQAKWAKESEERLKQYFTTMLPKGKMSGEKRLRILPTKDGTSPFVEVWFHEIQIDGKWTKLWDPKQEGLPSPISDLSNTLYEHAKTITDEKDRKEAFKLAGYYKARKFYVVKVIDRDNEDEGPKFWRFPHKKTDGIFEKIYQIIRKMGDITDPKEGRDLTLYLTSVKGNNGNFYTSVTQVLHEDPSPLSEKEDDSKYWISDVRTWSDVYSRKPIEFLQLVVDGKIPRWDKEKEIYVDRDELLQKDPETIKNEENTAPVVDPQADDPTDEDVPF